MLLVPILAQIVVEIREIRCLVYGLSICSTTALLLVSLRYLEQ